MKFVPFSRNSEHSDGEMMSCAEIEIRIDHLKRFSKVAESGRTHCDIETEILILQTVLGRRPTNMTTCGEHAMDVEWVVFGTRPIGFEE